MAGLQADDINEAFLKNLFTETLYMVGGENPAPAKPEAPVPPVPAKAVSKVAEEKPEPAVKNLILDHKPVDTPVIPHVPLPSAPAKYKVAGTNDKGVVVLVTLPDDAFEKLPQLTFLQKILYAIGLKPTDVAYVNNLSGATAKFEDLQQELQVSYIISFASRLDTVLPHDKFTLYHPVLVGDVPVVFSQALAMLEHNTEHKQLLWNALKKVFL
ncbi:hypothetical protein [Pontibacter russatus]|uniref:hypothetical protein n=1 Tax=Pontibacter russatus TaxID=2694929 RepID=UPI00137A3DE5|nr:hypothetical protein [Pontibacter russatus]